MKENLAELALSIPLKSWKISLKPDRIKLSRDNPWANPWQEWPLSHGEHYTNTQLCCQAECIPQACISSCYTFFFSRTSLRLALLYQNIRENNFLVWLNQLAASDLPRSEGEDFPDTVCTHKQKGWPLIFISLSVLWCLSKILGTNQLLHHGQNPRKVLKFCSFLS